MHLRVQLSKKPLHKFVNDQKQQRSIKMPNNRACSPRGDLQRQKTAQRSKIVKVSQLINKNICLRKEINLKDITNLNNDQPKTSRKKKLDISLSKQKAERERSISDRPTEQSSKVSFSNVKSIRKIKCFEVNQEVQESMKEIKSARRIKDIQNNQTHKEHISNKTKITLGCNTNYLHDKSRRKIKILKHNK